MNIIKKLISSMCVLTALGCQSGLNSDAGAVDSQQEYILSKVNNYSGLIKLYRDKLNKKENSDDRYKLARYYYLVEDYSASRLYLKPLLKGNPTSDTLLLESKNLLEQGSTSSALSIINRVLTKDHGNGEAWNIQGILMAQIGDFEAASKAFDEARSRFVDEEIVANNMAMLAIMREDYNKARDLLVPLYMRGQTSTKMLHNLVYVLVKLQDFHGAESILNDKEMSNNKEGLLESLAYIKPHSKEDLQKRYQISSKVQLTQGSGELLNSKGLAVRTQEPIKDTIPVSNKMMKINTSPTMNVASQQSNIASPQLETASLSVTGNLGEIHAVRAGQHQKYFRMTLESKDKIKFREIVDKSINTSRFELFNIKLTDYLLTSGKKITQQHAVVKKLNFYQKDVDTVALEFEFERNVLKKNVFSLTADNTANERLVFDIYM